MLKNVNLKLFNIVIFHIFCHFPQPSQRLQLDRPAHHAGRGWRDAAGVAAVTAAARRVALALWRRRALPGELFALTVGKRTSRADCLAVTRDQGWPGRPVVKWLLGLRRVGLGHAGRDVVLGLRAQRRCQSQRQCGRCKHRHCAGPEIKLCHLRLPSEMIRLPSLHGCRAKPWPAQTVRRILRPLNPSWSPP